MARSDPLLPNAGIVARREYRDRVRSPLFLVSTLVLMGLALAVALAPIALRYMDQQRVAQIVVVGRRRPAGSGHDRHGEGIMNIPRRVPDRATWTTAVRLRARDGPRRGRIRPVPAAHRRASWSSGGRPTGRSTSPTGRPARRTAFAASSPGSRPCRSASSTGRSRCRRAPSSGRSRRRCSGPSRSARPIEDGQAGRRRRGGQPQLPRHRVHHPDVHHDPDLRDVGRDRRRHREEQPGHGADDQRRLATPAPVRQGRGIGGAGLTQYARDRDPGRARARVPGPDRAGRARQQRRGPADRRPDDRPAARLRRCSSCMGFTLFALIYAAVGSFVSRPDDLQTLSLPLSLVAMGGYLSALFVLLGGGGFIGRLASFVPPFSPFAMLARLMVSNVQPWEVALSVGILLVTIASSPWRPCGSTRPACCSTASGPGSAAVHRGGAPRGLIGAPRQVSSSSGSRLSIARTGAVAEVAAGSSGASASSAAGIAARPRPGSGATAGFGRPAGRDPGAGAPSSRPGPGRRSPRTAPDPRWRSPAPRPPRHPDAGSGAAPRGA